MELNEILEEKWLKELEEDAKSLSLDKTVLAKKLIIDGIKQIRVKKLIPLYEQGEISIEQFAEQLDLTLYELLTILKQEKVPIGSNLNETREELANLKKRLNLSSKS
jgi:predicted HTH domain antitoxin